MITYRSGRAALVVNDAELLATVPTLADEPLLTMGASASTAPAVANDSGLLCAPRLVSDCSQQQEM